MMILTAMMRRLTCFALALGFAILMTLPLSGQREAAIWYFGFQSGIDFRPDAPIALLDSRSNALEGCVSYSDPQTGELLFYSNGFKIWRRDHQVMSANSAWLPGNQQDWPSSFSTTQAAMVVPHPGNDKLFYVFNPGNRTNPIVPLANNAQRLFNELSYTLVDMRKAGGMGEIVGHQALTPSVTMTEKLSGTAACRENGLSYWVLSTELNSNAFYAFHVDEDGVAERPVVSRIGPIHRTGVAGMGQMKISPDGSMLAVVNNLPSSGQLLLFRFDPTNGKVHSPVELNITDLGTGMYGLSFSPDNSLLYVADMRRTLMQFSVTDLDQQAIMDSEVRMSMPGSFGPGQLQIAPDRRIYIARLAARKLLRINFPNRAGPACELRELDLELSSANGLAQSMFGLPNYMDYIFSNSVTGCNTKTYRGVCVLNASMSAKKSPFA